MKQVGLLDAYENVYTTLIEEGWPQDKTPFDHAAYLILKWQNNNKPNLTGATLPKQSAY